MWDEFSKLTISKIFFLCSVTLDLYNTIPKKQEGLKEEKRENEQKTICFGYGYRVISSKGKTTAQNTER